MSYMIMAYGYEVEEDVVDISTLKKAEQILHKLVVRWCKEQDIDMDEVDYEKGDHYFQHGIEECGAATYQLLEVPEIKNEYDQLMWELRLDLEMIDAATVDYKCSLMECDVESITASAREKLDRIYAIEHP